MMIRGTKTYTCFFIMLMAIVQLAGQAQAELATRVVLKDLDSPWALAFISESKALITLKGGEVVLADLNKQRISSLPGVPESVIKGQGGLLDIELHPDFRNNQWLYLTFTRETDEGYTTALARAKFQQDKLVDTETIFTAKAFGGGGRHFGSRLSFDDRGFLYMSIGDRGERDYSQDLTRHHGKIVRLHDDGRIPEDNPFVEHAKALPEIFSYGHRNPQGMVFDRENKRLWIHEHGPRGGDELNLVQAGENYGWPLVSHGREYYGPRISSATEMEGVVSPVFQWTPSIAPSGMAIYQGELFPDWHGDILVGALKYQLLSRIELQGTQAVSEARYLQKNSRIRDVQIGPDDAIYVLTDGGRGQLWRVTPG